MILVLDGAASEEQIADVLAELGQLGLRSALLTSADKPLVHVQGGPTRRARKLLRLEAVQALVPTSGPRVRRRGRRFYPYHFMGWCAVALGLSGLLVLLAGQLPPGVGTPVDPLAAADGASGSAPWFLEAPLFAVERLGTLGWAALAALAVLLFALPWIDRTRGEGLARRWPFALLGLAGAALVVAFAAGGMS